MGGTLEVGTIRERAVRGAVWMVGTGTVTRAAGLVGTAVLLRYLTPNEYGDVCVAVTLVASANMLSTLGLGQYLTSRVEHDAAVAFHATALHVLAGAMALGVTWVLRNPLAAMLHAPQAATFVFPLCLAF